MTAARVPAFSTTCSWTKPRKAAAVVKAAMRGEGGT